MKGFLFIKYFDLWFNLLASTKNFFYFKFQLLIISFIPGQIKTIGFRIYDENQRWLLHFSSLTYSQCSYDKKQIVFILYYEKWAEHLWVWVVAPNQQWANENNATKYFCSILLNDVQFMRVCDWQIVSQFAFPFQM